MSLPRFAILSHILPPSPSGQSVTLYRIFSGFNPNDYYLVSCQPCENKYDKEYSLPVEYFYVLPPRLLRWLNKQKMPRQLRDFINVLFLVLWRAYKLVAIVRNNPVGIIIACTGDIADIPAGYLASRVLGVEFYAYLFDDYVYQWIGFQRSIAKFLASLIFKNVAGIIGPNEYICEEYKFRYGSKYVIVHNPCNPDELNFVPRDKWPSESGKIKIMYTGAIYHANYDCFRNLIYAMNKIVNHQVELHIYTAQTVEQLSAQGIEGEKVHIHSHVPYNQILEEQHIADILFLPLAFESPIPEVLRTSAPGKMGEYLASGRPVLAHVPADSFVAYYLKKNLCGMVADESSPSNLAERIMDLISDNELRNTITKNARQQARLDFDPQTSRDCLRDFLISSADRKQK